MSLLLDTPVVLWWLADDPTLADDIKDRLDHEPDVYVSAATVWEVVRADRDLDGRSESGWKHHHRYAGACRALRFDCFVPAVAGRCR